MSHEHTMTLTFDWVKITRIFQSLSIKQKLSRSEAEQIVLTFKEYLDIAIEPSKQILDKMAI